MHGHKYVIDTFLAVTALDQPGAVVVFTSDVDDLTKLLAEYPRVVVQRI
jgi:6-pyruvoyl-tetrahydropterin synthase